jgi:hypothetical protein
MKCSLRYVSVVAVAVTVAGQAACGGRLPEMGQTGGAGGSAGGGGAGAGGAVGTTGAGGNTCPGRRVGLRPPEVPPEHRATVTACAPSQQPPLPDGGLSSCTSDADCAPDGGTFSFYATCLQGTCSFDQCLTDSDCANGGVCGCSSDYYGGNIAYHPNVCVPAQCHVDADCGAAGYCSPSRGYCGSYTGFYCHGSADTCVDPTADCAGCPGAGACVYAPTVGAFVCGLSACNG